MIISLITIDNNVNHYPGRKIVTLNTNDVCRLAQLAYKRFKGIKVVEDIVFQLCFKLDQTFNFTKIQR